ncbi:Zinc metalloproteinase nas-7 [Orchesella cincta]|uniref:Zinc metalloproteinase nas-7 n=1 Tax=Orchesella cincta TaxID=48709 RepID=A0A1D2M0I0_ORCCI|nr:Zinc metalloproteinase nas-7 [Orchesella cincta]
MKFFVALTVVVLQLAVCYAGLPNYITQEEFAAIRGQKIPIGILLCQNMERVSTWIWSTSVDQRRGSYTLDPTFSDEQRIQVALAIQAYHDATCIRFIPKEDHHQSWVDILHDPTVCGVAHVCMNTGAQFAKFGGSCVSAGTMV